MFIQQAIDHSARQHESEQRRHVTDRAVHRTRTATIDGLWRQRRPWRLIGVHRQHALLDTQIAQVLAHLARQRTHTGFADVAHADARRVELVTCPSPRLARSNGGLVPPRPKAIGAIPVRRACRLRSASHLPRVSCADVCAGHATSSIAV